MLSERTRGMTKAGCRSLRGKWSISNHRLWVLRSRQILKVDGSRGSPSPLPLWFLLWRFKGNSLCFQQLFRQSHRRPLSKNSAKQGSTCWLYFVICGKYCPGEAWSLRLVLQCVWESPRRLLEADVCAPPSWVSDSKGLRWGSRISTSNKIPKVAGPGSRLWGSLFGDVRH